MEPVALIGGAGLLLVFVVVGYFAQEQCPACKSRGSVSWRFARKGGGRDQRFRDNAKTCSSCGWASDAEQRAATRAAEHAAATELQARLDQIEAEARDLPVVAFISLLKYVATADRQFSEAEKQALVASVHELFPGRWSDGSILRWMEKLPATDLAISSAEHIEVSLRPAALRVISHLATVDGKVTPAEKRRLAEVQAALSIA